MPNARLQSAFVLGAAVALLPGCAIVASAPGSLGGEGIAYMLPRALLPIELLYAQGGFDLRVGDPVVTGDVQHTYLLQRSGNVFSSDNVTIAVDPATGLLTSLDVKSKDEFVPTIARLAGALKAEAADAGAPEVVFRDLLDPGADMMTQREFARRLNAAAIAHVARELRAPRCGGAQAPAECTDLIALQADLRATPLEVLFPAGNAVALPPIDCGKGFCYRVNQPQIVRLDGPGVSTAAVISLPNRSPTFVMPLERWPFVKTTHDVKLEAGVFKSVTTDRPSSALALAAAPLEVAQGVADTVSTLVQLKIDLSGKEKALVDAKVAEIAAQQALDKALLDKAKGQQAESAIVGGRGDTRTVALSLRVGKPLSRDVNANLGPRDGQPNTGTNPAERTSTGSGGSAGRP